LRISKQEKLEWQVFEERIRKAIRRAERAQEEVIKEMGRLGVRKKWWERLRRK
jgi:hypothetical protein